MKKNPILAAILNIIIPGLGYIYIGTRQIFGWIVLVSLVPGIVAAVAFPPNTLSAWDVCLIIGSIILGVAFAVDAYLLAKETNRKPRSI